MKHLKALVHGYKNFLRNEDTDQFRKLAVGQSPQVMVIGCCDSRVNPDLIFNSVPGELFVVRNVANLVPPYQPDESYHGTSAALEFAVTGLNVAHIVVMGHSACGGVKACCDSVRGHKVGGEFIPQWTSMISGCASEILERSEDLTDGEFTRLVEQGAIKTSLQNLKTFPFITSRIESGELTIHGAYFDIKEAQLYALDRETDDFLAVD